jgi:Endonuclease-reverse transcriptase
MLNDPDTKNFTMLMIQEQYWCTGDDSVNSDHSWTPFEPMGAITDKQPRSAIYVNKNSLAAARITQLPILSTDITAIQIMLQDSTKPSLFVNIYNPCDDSALPALKLYFQGSRVNLTSNSHDLVIVAGDFNCHHPTWNPPGYTRHDEEADKLVDIASDLGLGLLIPPGTVTFPNAGTAIDLVWANNTAANRMLKCHVSQAHDQGSDHLAIETLLTAEMQKAPEVPSFNYDKTDWEEFNKVLPKVLPHIPHPSTLWSAAAIDGYTEQLTNALTKATEETTPNRKPCPHSKRWWTPQLT